MVKNNKEKKLKVNSNVCCAIAILCVLAKVAVGCFVTHFVIKTIIVSALFITTLVMLALVHKKKVNDINSALQALAGGTPKVSSSLLNIYAILGIPPQYNPDGTLKDIYQLLQIEPQYDADGKRLLTIYELIGANPVFDKDGKEIPFVVRIKNRVDSIAKIKEGTLPLTYKSQQAQIMGKVSAHKIQEIVNPAEKTEQKIINKAPVQKVVKKASAPKGAKKQPVVNYGAPGKKIDVKDPKLSEDAPKIPNINIIKEIFSLFSSGKKESKPNIPPVRPQPTIHNIPSQQRPNIHTPNGPTIVVVPITPKENQNRHQGQRVVVANGSAVNVHIEKKGTTKKDPKNNNFSKLNTWEPEL